MENSQTHTRISFLGIISWLLAALFFLYEFFLRTFIGSLAHQIIPALKLNAETFSIVGIAYYVAYGTMQVPVGILVDKIGVKRIMVFAALTCALATYLFAHSWSFFSALISRFFMGFGSSFAFISLLIIASTWFPKRLFGFFAGLSQFIGTLGPLLAGGPLIALMLAAHENWRQALNNIAYFGIFLAICALFILKNKPSNKSDQIVLLKRKTSLIKNLRKLFKNTQVWYIALYSSTVYVSLALLGVVWGTEYLQTRGLSQSAAANMISLSWLGYAIGCPILGAFSDLIKRRNPLLISSAALGLIMIIMIIFLPLNSMLAYSIPFFLLGVAGSGQNIGFAAIAEHATEEARATAMGLNNSAITLCNSLIIPLVSYIINLMAKGSSTLTTSNFIFGFSLMPILSLIALITAIFLIRETHCKPQQEAIRLQREN